MDKVFTRIVKSVYPQVSSSVSVTSVSRKLTTLSLRLGTYSHSIGNGYTKETPRVVVRCFHTDQVLYLRDKKHRGNILRNVEKPDEGVDETPNPFIDIRGFGTVFPDEHTPDQMYGDEKFSELPIVNVTVSRNNTHLLLADVKGNRKLHRTCGIEGFKNTKKGTNVAAQVTAETFALQAYHRGFRNVKVSVRGLGPGRLAALKGLVAGGLNVVCVADSTPISFNIDPRPRKAKKGARLY